ncbi:hypothetical protein ACSW0U_001735, partial [Vibrio fluvialis]
PNNSQWGRNIFDKTAYQCARNLFSMRRYDSLTPAASLLLFNVWICDFTLFSGHKKSRDEPGIFIRS